MSTSTIYIYIIIDFSKIIPTNIPKTWNPTRSHRVTSSTRKRSFGSWLRSRPMRSASAEVSAEEVSPKSSYPKRPHPKIKEWSLKKEPWTKRNIICKTHHFSGDMLGFGGVNVWWFSSSFLFEGRWDIEDTWAKIYDFTLYGYGYYFWAVLMGKQLMLHTWSQKIQLQ